jgi:hypothetical protein
MLLLIIVDVTFIKISRLQLLIRYNDVYTRFTEKDITEDRHDRFLPLYFLCAIY